MRLWVGTAGWNIPKIHAGEFPAAGSHLERYAARLPGVEINSSFYRDHQAKTYARWATTVPQEFRFSVKLHRRFTHEGGLKADPTELAAYLSVIGALGARLGVLLVQLPPSRAFDLAEASRFFGTLRAHFSGRIACEPRHLSWAGLGANALFADFEITKVRADPAPCPVKNPEEWESGFRYWRLHGSPEIYKSDYPPRILSALPRLMHESGEPAWCIFDNTTFGHAWKNALETWEGAKGADRLAS